MKIDPTRKYKPFQPIAIHDRTWPSQVITGQGIGWLCHMGRAMIREFGREYGYRGAEGLLWKHIEDEGRAEGPRNENAPLTPAAQDKR